MILRLYRRLMRHAAPFLRLLVTYRAWRGLEETSHRSEREGSATLARPSGTLLWVHAASVGEMQSILPLVRRLLAQNPAMTCLVTTVTVTAARLVRQINNPRIVHQYAPFDCPPWVETFLDHWKPSAAIWVESELWPNTLEAISARNIPLMLVNGRLSARSAKRWQDFARTDIAALFGLFDATLAQSENDARRMSQLGARGVIVAGNMKFSRDTLPCDETALAALRAQIGDRPVVLFASTHAGEEEMAARLYGSLAAKHPNVLFIVMPRHPSRGDTIAGVLEAEKITFARRSLHQPITADTQIYVADTLGEPGLFFRVSRIAYIGNSLISSPGGGHNPIEAAQLGCAILYGPHMYNFAEIERDLRAAQASLLVHRESELSRTLERLLSDPAEVEKLGRAAQNFVAQQNGILDKVLSHLRKDLARGEITA